MKLNRRLALLFAIVSASGAAAFVGACGGSDSTAIDGGDATTQDTGTDTNVGDTSTDTAPGIDAGACKNLGTIGCRMCCAALYPDAAAFFVDQERTCACTTPGDCKGASVCGNNLCNGMKASQTCDTCLHDRDAGDCFGVAAAACLGDPTCQPLAACAANCMGPVDAGGGG